ncbi:MAG: 16S rRNA (cytidine(1402)-2'-O)-methyltransferase [Acidobacteria bacterium]|nr:16S rRNA (cytidine(1402)-2'-O)-methyltransferase [Acidobacteriota bacterium]
MSGVLVVVATPIGNLDELSPRARAALVDADVVACEDTRRTGRLFDLCGLAPRPPFVSLHEHNEAERASDLVDRCRAGSTVALVSDAGMPTISDPGARLVEQMHEAGITISVVSGPSAVVSALAVSGFVADRFVFEGFLPRKGAARQQVVESIAADTRTVVLYESPHRIESTMRDLTEACEDERLCVVVRELSKLHEQIWRGPLGDYQSDPAVGSPRGEYVVVVEGAPQKAPAGDDELRAALVELLDDGLTKRDASALVSRRFGVSKRRVYEMANEK